MAFNGKVAMVTGGASGMGRVMALRLARAGATVAIVDLNQSALDATVTQAPNILGFRCDVTDEEQVLATVARIENELGPIDRLAHAAGIMPGDTILNMPAQKIVGVMQVNYFGTVFVTKAVLPRMLQRNQGDIVIFGSITGYAFSGRFSAYCASKAAVNSFAEVLIHEQQKSNLRILLACPPAVDTPLISQALDNGPQSVKDAAKSKRMASPESIIDAIEKALEKGRTVILPGEARFAHFLRRLSPALLWKIADRMEKLA